MSSGILLGEVTSHWAQASHLGIWYQSSYPSTSDIAKEQAFDDQSKVQSIRLYLTDQQTQGRGRAQNSWVSPEKGSALLSSWSFAMSEAPQPVLAPLVGLAVFRAFFTTWPALPLSLKAPNDLYLGDRKIGGILLENVQEGTKNRLIIGLGINILAAPESIKTSGCLVQYLPTGLSLTGEDWTQLLDRLLLELTMAASLDTSEGLSDSSRLALLFALNRHPLLDEAITGIDPDGSLYKKEKKIAWSEL